MKRFNTLLWLVPRPRALLATLALLAAAGCVSQGAHDDALKRMQAQERELTSRVENEERSNRALTEENLRLADALEDMRLVRDELAIDNESLRRSRDLLSEDLRARDSELEELVQTSETYRGLVADLQSEVTSGQIEIEQLRDGIRLNLPQEILFPSGSVALDARGETVLRKVSARLRATSYRIEVRGYSDDKVLVRALATRFGTNWELAGARASRVVRLLEGEGIEGTRMTAVSYGRFAPIASNETPEGRARNRRIEIRLVPDARSGETGAGVSPASRGVPGDS